LAASSKSGGGYYWMARLDEVLGEMRSCTATPSTYTGARRAQAHRPRTVQRARRSIEVTDGV
jgi:hypothetical protein